MATITSRSPEETFALGQQFGVAAAPGELLGLIGDLGAGKTEFVKGLARSLSFQGRVHSPTFALLNEYTGGRLPIYHIDLYRLEGARDLISAGLDDYFYQRDGVTVIEWADRLNFEDSPYARLALRAIRFVPQAGNERLITYDDPRA